jgi:hypothetical protein
MLQSTAFHTQHERQLLLMQQSLLAPVSQSLLELLFSQFVASSPLDIGPSIGRTAV